MPDNKSITQLMEELDQYEENGSKKNITDKTTNRNKTKEELSQERINSLQEILDNDGHITSNKIANALDSKSTTLDPTDIESLPVVSSAMTDVEMTDIRADRQSNLDKLGNGLANMGAQAITGAAETIINPIVGTAAALTGGSYYDNAFTQSLDKFTETVKKDMPIYYSSAQEKMMEDQNFLQQMIPGSGVAMNFWADKVLGGVGYTVGIAAAALGVGAVGRLLGTAAEAVEGETLVAKGFTKGAEDIAKKKLANKIVTGAYLGQGEASMEARTTKNEIITNLKEDRDKGLNQYSDTEIADIAASKGNINFGINAVLNGTLNATLMKNFIGGQFADKVATNAVKKDAEGLLVDVTLGKYAGAKNALKQYGKGFILEGNEEMLQAVSNKALNNYTRAENHDGYMASIGDILNATTGALSSQYGTMSGLEEGFIGGLTGGLFGLKGARGERSAREANTQKLINFYNTDPGFAAGIVNNISNTARSFSLSEKANKALNKNDRFEYENAKHGALVSYIDNAIDNNALPVLKETIESLASVGDEEFRKAFDYKSNYQFKPGEKAQIVDKTLNKIKAIEKRKELINEALPYVANKKATKEQQAIEYIANSNLKSALLFTDSAINNVDERIGKLINKDIANIAPDFASALMSNDLESIKSIKNMLSPLALTQIKAYEKDVNKLREHKQELINAQKELLTKKAEDAAVNDASKVQDAIKETITNNAKPTEEELADDAQQAANEADNLKVKINTLADKIAERGHGQDDSQLTSAEMQLKANHAELLNARLAEIQKIKEGPKETKTTPSGTTDLEALKQTPEGKKIEEERKLKLNSITQDVINDINAELGMANTYTIKSFKDKINAEYNLELAALKREPTTTPTDLGKIYPSPAILVKEYVSEGDNKLLEGEDYENQLQRIEKTIASGIKKGLTREQIFQMLSANGHVFNAGNDIITVNNFIQNRIDGKETRTFNQFAENTREIKNLEGEVSTQDVEDLLNTEDTEVVEVITNENPIPDNELSAPELVYASYLLTLNKTTGVHFTDKDDTKLTENKSQQRWYAYLQKPIKEGYRLMFITAKSNPKLWNKLVDDEKYAADKKEAEGGIIAVLVDNKNNPIIADINGNEITESTNAIKENIKDFKAESMSTGWVFAKLEVANEKVKDKISRQRVADLLNIFSVIPLNKDSEEVTNYINEEFKKLADNRKQILDTKDANGKHIVSYSEIDTHEPGKLVRNLSNPGTVEDRINSLDKIDLEVAKSLEGKVTTLTKALNKQAVNSGLYAIDKTTGRAEKLSSRKLVKEEIDLAYQILFNIANGITTNLPKLPKNILEDLIYVGSKLGITKDGKDLNIQIDYKTKKITIAGKIFNGQAIYENEDFIKRILADRLVQSNGNYDFNMPFLEYTLEGNNVVLKKEWSSYKEYLLNGTDRKAPFTTTIASSKEGGIKSKSPYLTFSKVVAHTVADKIETNTNAEISELEDHSSINVDDTEETDASFDPDDSDIEIQDLETLLAGQAEKGKKIDVLVREDESGELDPNLLNKAAVTKEIKYKKQDLTKELGWFTKAFPNIPVTLVKQLIDGAYFGRFIDSGVLLYNAAEEGTIYHEAFHVTSQIYLGKKQIAKLYKEARERLNKPNATDIEIEEVLAEDFRKYVLSNGTEVFEKAPYKVSAFRRLLNLIKSLFNLKTSGEIEKVYQAIYSGKYANANTINNNQFKQLLNRKDLSKEDAKPSKIVENAEPLNGDYAFDKDVLDTVQYYFYERLDAVGKSVVDLSKYRDLKSVLLTGTKSNGEQIKGLKTVRTILNNKAVDLQEEYNADTTKEYILPVLNNFIFVLNNFDQVTKRFETRLSNLGKGNVKEVIDVTEDMLDVDSLDTAEDTSVKDAKKAGEAFNNANEQSTKETMFAGTKFLVSSLPALNKNNTPKLNSTLGTPTLVDFNETYGMLLHSLAGLTDIADMYNKITELSKYNPAFTVLLDRLKSYDGVLTEEQFVAQKQFQQDFAKTKTESYITIVEGDKIFTTSANKNALSDKIKTQWDANSKSESKYIKKIATGYTVDYDKVKAANLSDVQFLYVIGIKLNQEVIDRFAKTPEFMEAVKFIRESVNYNFVRNEPFDLYSKNSNVKGRIDYLLGLEAEFNNDVVELSYISSEGKTIYQMSLNNLLSKVTNAINQATTIDELYKKLPHLNTSNTRNSVFLQSIFNKDGKRKEIKGKPIKLELALLDGLKNNDVNEGTKTTSLSGYDKILFDFNNLLKTGLSPYMRAADKSTEFGFRISQYQSTELSKRVLPITIEQLENSFDNAVLLKIFRGYLKDELRAIKDFKLKNTGGNIDKYKSVAGKFRIFDEILQSEDLKDRLLNSALVNDANLNAEGAKLLLSSFRKEIDAEIINFFNRYFDETSDLFTTYDLLTPLSEETGEGTVIKKGLDESLNKYKRDNLIRAFIANNLISNIEQTKLFIGDLGFYSDLFKRTSAMVGTKEYTANDPSTISQINKIYEENPRSDGKKASDKLDVVVWDDIKIKSNYVNSYVETLVKSNIKKDTADLILNAYFKMDEADAQGIITLDAYREYNLRVGSWSPAQSAAYNKAIKGEILTGEEIAIFPIIKAQCSGPQSFKEGDVNSSLYAPAFHKFSLLPIFPQLVKGTNMQKVYDKMTNKANPIDYALFRSGSKVGTLVNADGTGNKFYTEGNTGNITEKDDLVQQISWSYLGTQVRIDAKVKDKMTFGTQFRKLILSNLFDNGVGENYKDIVSEYNKIIKGLTEIGKKKLLDEFGFTVEGKTVTKSKLVKLINALKKASIDRALPDNLVNSLQEASKEAQYMLKYPIDSLVNQDKIESMLMSLVNARIIKQSVNGDALIQASVAGFEKLGERKEFDNTLPFYQMIDKNGNPTTDKSEAVKVSKAGCKVPANGQYDKLLKRLNLTIDEANIELNKLNAGKPSKIKEEWVSLVGYRIPTQGLNSIENLIITQFLPAESGSLIILPSEIVAKSGGDFDVDKLNVFKPNLDLDAESEDLIYSADTSNKRGDDYSYVNTKQLTNRLMEISQKLLSDPENFISLITPNSTRELTRNVEDKLNGMRALRGQPVKPKLTSITQQLKYKHVLEQFIYFLTGKAGVGIGAVHNTHHTLSQISNLRITEELTKEFFIKPKTIDAANKITLGNIYNINGIKISDILSEFINAYVDIAKDPFIFDLNGGTDSAGVYFLLIRTGADFDTIVRFMNQPIVAEFAKLKQLNKSVTKDKVKDETIIKELADKYFKLYTDIGGQAKDLAKENYDVYSTEDNKLLESFIKRGFKNGEYQDPAIEIDRILNDKQITAANKDKVIGDIKRYLKAQIQFINNYSTYNKMSMQLSEVMQASNHDTAGLGKNVQAAKDKIKLINKLKSKTALADAKLKRIAEEKEANKDNLKYVPTEKMEIEDYSFIPNWENTVKGTFINSMNQNELAVSMYKDMFISHSDKQIDNELIELLDGMNSAKDVRPKLNTLLRNDFIQYLVQNYYKVDDKKMSELREDLFKGPNSLAKRVLKIRNSLTPTAQEKALMENRFFKELLPVLEQSQIGSNTTSDNLKLFVKKFDTQTSNIFTQEFRKIKDISPEIYNDIIKLGILQSGLNNSPITFVGLIPFEEHGDIVNSAVKEYYKKNGASQLSKFKQLFYRNNFRGLLTSKGDRSYGSFLEGGIFKLRTGALLPYLGNGMFGKNYSLDNWKEETPVIKEKAITQQQVPTGKVKEGVVELFESTPELANVVYESLGFKNAIIEIPNKYELDKEYNLKSVLNNLLNTENKSISNIYKVLLNSIPSNLKLIYSKNIRQDASGEFIYLEDVIKINPNKLSHKTLIHEIIHALTHDTLLKNEEFNNKITVLRKQAIQYFENNRPRAIQGSTKSALASNDEFLAGLFDYKNLDFLNTLNNIPIENTTLLKKIKNIFKDLINEVANIAGIKLNKNSLLFEVINELGEKETSQITPQQKQQAQQLYSQYLDTIFPDSKVKDIVYHWSVGSQISEQFGDDLGRVKGIWISKDPNQWKDIIKNKSKRLGINEIKKHVLIINANNVWVDSTLSSPEGSNFPKGYDTIAAYDEADLTYSGDLKPEFKNIEGFEAVIKLKNQTYELGNKQDIEGFKKFVNKKSTEEVKSTSLESLLEQPKKISVFGVEVLEPTEEDIESNLTNDEVESFKKDNLDTFEENSKIVCYLKLNNNEL